METYSMASKKTLCAEKVIILTHQSKNLVQYICGCKFQQIAHFQEKTCPAFILFCETGIDFLTGCHCPVSLNYTTKCQGSVFITSIDKKLNFFTISSKKLIFFEILENIEIWQFSLKLKNKHNFALKCTLLWFLTI